MNFYPFHIGDYLSHTAHLTDAEDLAYRRMIDLYYQQEKPFIDAAVVARRVRSTVEIVQTILDEFFTPSVDGWRHIRCDEEIAKYHTKADSARKANARRWEPKSDLKSDKESDLKSEQKRNADQILTKNQEPRTNNQDKPIKRASAPPAVRPDDVSESVWADFLAIRKAKRSPLTATALAGIGREATKAGLTLESALKTCCERGWQGFRADWVGKDKADGRGFIHDIKNMDYTRGVDENGNF